MSGDIHYLTEEGLTRLKKELKGLRSGRSGIAAAIKEAREKGDLKENAEYDAAKEAQGMHEMKINQLENVVGNARIIDESKVDTSMVTVLTLVSVKNLKINKEFKYKLVSEKEADLKTGKISVTSPIGKGLLGKKVGEIATIVIPAGTIEFEILHITI
ncbi:MAG: transcription elongation factor GreA [Limisphaerales bacterium]|jgi:transcription elongation factor GreA